MFVAWARSAVLELRGRKGMLLDSSDNQIMSAGSFFVNPIISKEDAINHLSNFNNPSYLFNELFIKTDNINTKLSDLNFTFLNFLNSFFSPEGS